MNFIPSRRLHSQVKEMLLEEILHGEYSKDTMLPSETELCARLNVSRGTLRQSVTSLEQEGYLRRRQGIGTIIDRNICSIKTRVDLKIEFSELIHRAGYKPRVKLIEMKEEPAGEEYACFLRIHADDRLIHITKEWLADERPAILCTDTFPVRLIQEPYTEEIFEKDIFTVLKALCHEEVDYQIAHIVPWCLGEELAGIFGAPVNQPVICFNGVSFNVEGVPIICNTEYFAPGILDLTLLRARI